MFSPQVSSSVPRRKFNQLLYYNTYFSIHFSHFCAYNAYVLLFLMPTSLSLLFTILCVYGSRHDRLLVRCRNLRNTVISAIYIVSIRNMICSHKFKSVKLIFKVPKFSQAGLTLHFIGVLLSPPSHLLPSPFSSIVKSPSLLLFLSYIVSNLSRSLLLFLSYIVSNLFLISRLTLFLLHRHNHHTRI